MIEVKDLSFSYNGKRVIDGISFNIEKGKMVSISGPNGSGKTTLLKILARIIDYYDGEVLIEKKRIKEYTLKGISRLISYVPGEVNTPFDFKVRDIVLMGRLPYISFLGSYRNEDLEIVERVAKDIGIDLIMERYYNTLSNGEKQLVLVAQAVAQQTKIIIMDEPTSHLDIKHKINIFEFLKNESKIKGTTIIVVLHDLKLAEEFCDEVLFLKEGKLIYNILGRDIKYFTKSISSVYEIDEEIFKKYLL